MADKMKTVDKVEKMSVDELQKALFKVQYSEMDYDPIVLAELIGRAKKWDDLLLRNPE